VIFIEELRERPWEWIHNSCLFDLVRSMSDIDVPCGVCQANAGQVLEKEINRTLRVAEPLEKGRKFRVGEMPRRFAAD
jgi:hypothetical protein